MKKTCTGECKRELEASPDNFHIRKQMRDGLKSQCKQCQAKQNKAYRETPAGAVIITRANLRRCCRLYDITVEDYDKLFADQGGVCAICGASPGKKKLAIDHNHKTGKVRGLLCMSCNVVLGHTDENIEILEDIIAYIKKDEK